MPVNKPKYKNGLVVGKFSPLHKGHELLIRTAKSQCSRLYVFAYSNPEIYGFENIDRKAWLSDLFPDVISFSLKPESVLAKFGIQMPENDAPAKCQRLFVGKIWQALVGEPLDAVFTSEAYGDGFAKELTRFFSSTGSARTVNHELVDLDRHKIPISATSIRSDIHKYKEFLSPQVYASFVRRVCFIGAESTGKSTLAEGLAREFETQFVTEYGRTLWEERQGLLVYEDMLKIARAHVEMEDQTIQRANRFLFIDTNPLTTLLYSQNMFGVAAPELVELANRKYDLTFLCMPDFFFVQDGTRSGIDFQKVQHVQYLVELRKRRIEYISLSGTLRERLATVKHALERFM